MRNTRTCGEAIVALLEAYGVDTVFGIPGVHTLELYRGLVGSAIRHILPRHEQGAGFMADGYARATGKPGVCFLITGPGVTNAATAIGEAYADSVPMLVISSVNESRHLGKGRGELHELPDQQKLMSACTAFSARAESPDQIPGLIARAFAVFQSARPRPVHIEVPIDIFEKQVTDVWEPKTVPAKPTVPEADLKSAVTALSQAERRLMIVGGGLKSGFDALRQLAENLNAPVVTTTAGSGALPCDHPLSLGPTLVSRATHELIAASDCVLAIGTELASTETWDIAFTFRKLIRLDIDRAQFSNHHHTDIALHGDAADAVSRLAATIKQSGHGAQGVHDAVAAALNSFEAVLDADEKARATAFRTVLSALPEDTLVACDMTQIGYTGHAVFRPQTPGRMLFPQGYGTLGYGLPAAIGAKAGAREKPVVAFVGDGGLQYTLAELGTAAEENLPVICVLWNNRSLKQIRDGFIEKRIDPIAVDPIAPDFQAIAKAFGWLTAQVSDVEGLRGATDAAFASAIRDKKPTLIEIDALAFSAD